MNGDVAVGPGARLERDRRERADDAVVVDQRGDELAGELEHAVVAVVAVLAHAADVLARDHPAGAQHLAGPALVAAEDREGRRDLVADARPGRDLEAVVAQDPDRRAVGAQRPHGLVDDGPEQLLPVVGLGEALGDAQDRVQPLGELDLEGAGDARRAPPVPRPAARPRGAAGRGTATARPRGVAEDSGPGHPGFALVVVLTHAHVPMVAPRGPFQRRASGPERGPYGRTGCASDTGLVDRPKGAGLHSARADSRNAAEPAVPSRTQEVSAPSWTTVPVDATPPEASSPGTRSAPLPDG